MFIQNKHGFTLIELIIVMGIFLTVIMITATAFNTIVNNSSQQSKSVETQIEGIVGLEILRSDLEQAGFGLPWEYDNNSSKVGCTYGEAVSTNVSTATLFNDAPENAPRAVLSGDTSFNNGSKYLVIKSTLAAANDTSKKWTIVSFDKAGVMTPPRQWGTTDRDLTSTERVIVVKNSLMTTPPTRQLMTSGTAFSATFGVYSTLIKTHQNGDTFEIYGVNPNTDLRMPFNRADYYVKRPGKMPVSCAPNTGILYKSTVIQDTGSPTIGMPLLDCVADMQVVYGLDTTEGAGYVNLHTPYPLSTAKGIRDQLREIRVYILAQEGKKDRLYTYPSTTIDVGESFDGGTTVMGRRFDLQTLIGPDYKYYRWKVYTIVVRPKNLIQ